MEQWEIELREKLDKEIEDGAYNISTDGVTLWTGKEGYKMYFIEIERMMREIKQEIEKHLNEEE